MKGDSLLVKNIFKIILITFSSLTMNTVYANIVSFPGAEGYGAISIGGRGGKVIEVTTTDDIVDSTDSVISFREAVITPEPRIIIFKVSGTINLTSPIDLNATHSFMTIAGQTAPGDGVQIKGDSFNINPGAHDIIIRFMKFRPGYNGNPETITTSRGVSIYGTDNEPTYNIIIDHCSISWTPDEMISIWGNTYNVTVQKTMLAEGLYVEGIVKRVIDGVLTDVLIKERSKAILVGQGNNKKPPYNISLHHNYFANNDQRNPSIAAIYDPNKPYTEIAPVNIINNLIYNWGGFGTEINNNMEPKSGVNINLIGNVYKRGPNTSTTRYEVGVQGFINREDPTDSTVYEDIDLVTPSYIENLIYVEDNLGPHTPSQQEIDDGQLSQEEIDWAIVGLGDLVRDNPVDQTYISYLNVIAPIEFKRVSAWGNSQSPAQVTRYSSTELDQIILDDVGSFFPTRDSVELRQINDYVNNTGRLSREGEEQIPTDWPELLSGPNYLDTDEDGMPDNWELHKNLDPGLINDKADNDGNGYTNIEDYINARAQDTDANGDGVLDGDICYSSAIEVYNDSIDQNCINGDAKITIKNAKFTNKKGVITLHVEANTDLGQDDKLYIYYYGDMRWDKRKNGFWFFEKEVATKVSEIIIRGNEGYIKVSVQ